MKIIQNFLIITLILLMTSCGKKAFLERYPGSDFPKNHPVQDEE